MSAPLEQGGFERGEMQVSTPTVRTTGTLGRPSDPRFLHLKR